jgi:hypothetical protein
MKLGQLVAAANDRYPDQYLSQYFDMPREKFLTRGCGDGLARFIVVEIRDTFDPAATDEAQVDEAIRVLEQGQNDLESALRGLRTLKEKVELPAEGVNCG